MYALTQTDGDELLQLEDEILELTCELTDVADRLNDPNLTALATRIRRARIRLSAVKLSHFEDDTPSDATPTHPISGRIAPRTRPQARPDAPSARQPPPRSAPGDRVAPDADPDR